MPPTSVPITGTPNRRHSSVEIPRASAWERRHPKWNERTSSTKRRKVACLVDEPHRAHCGVARKLGGLVADDDDLDRMPHLLQPRRNVKEYRPALALPVDTDEPEPEWRQVAVPRSRRGHGGFVDVGAGQDDSDLLRRDPVGGLHVLGAPARHADDVAGLEIRLLLPRQRLALDPLPQLALVLLEVLVHRRVDVVAHRLPDHLPRRQRLKVAHVLADATGGAPLGPQRLKVRARVHEAARTIEGQRPGRVPEQAATAESLRTKRDPSAEEADSPPSLQEEVRNATECRSAVRVPVGDERAIAVRLSHDARERKQEHGDRGQPVVASPTGGKQAVALQRESRSNPNRSPSG